MLKLSLAATTTAILLAATPASGAEVFTVVLTTSQEPTPVNPTLSNGTPRPVSFGSGIFQLNDSQTALMFMLTVYNIDFTGTQSADINDNLSNAHIHAGQTIIPAAPVVWGFFGSPFNDTNPANTIITPFATGVGGTVTGTWDALEGNNTTLTAQLSNILAGNAYVNFHTVQFAGGEIRGTLSAVPEPAVWGLMLIGFGGIGHSMRRRSAVMSLATA